MTEYFVVKEDGTEVPEKDLKWNDIDFRVKKIGIKHNGEVLTVVDVPEDAEGVTQCRLAIQHLTTEAVPVAHIVGYRKDGKFYTSVCKAKGIDIDDNLNLLPHTVFFK